jgi:hypothetical protein
LPTAQNLRSASRGGGNREKQKQGELTLDLFGEKLKHYTDLLWERACRIAAKAINQPARFRISSHFNCGSQPAGDAA